jgi:PEP-CTERM motif
LHTDQSVPRSRLGGLISITEAKEGLTMIDLLHAGCSLLLSTQSLMQSLPTTVTLFLLGIGLIGLGWRLRHR